jgi:hypothetical protein
VNLNYIFETLINIKYKKLVNIKHVYQVGHYTFGVNYVNIQGLLEILNFELQNL